MKRALAVALCVGLAAVGLLAVWLARALSPVADAGAAEVIFVVEPGDSLGRVAQNLELAGLLRDADLAEAFARVLGLAPRLRAGEYAISPSMSARAIFEHIASGQVVTHPVVVPEGFTVAQIAPRPAEPAIGGEG